MNERIAAGAAAVVSSLTGLTFIGRVWPAPTGRHRRGAAPAPAPARALLDDLLGPWPPTVPERVHGAAVVPVWHDCPSCDKATVGTINKDGWTCGECLTPVVTGGAS